MSPELTNLIESLSPEEQRAIELWIRTIKPRLASGGGLSPMVASPPGRRFPFGEGADDPVVRGTPAQQEELWRAMTGTEVNDFYEGRY
jgi:hypothetical protein